jgi:hypothetical protein
MAETNPTENTFWGPDEIKKRCSRCGKSKPLADFPLRFHRYYGRKCRSARCTECERAEAKSWKNKNLDRVRECRRRISRKSKFGMTNVQYRKMIESQNGLCAICGNPETTTRGRRLKELSVDHNHETGTVRELLCAACNTGIGLLKDSPELLRKAAVYLEKHAQP